LENIEDMMKISTSLTKLSTNGTIGSCKQEQEKYSIVSSKDMTGVGGDNIENSFSGNRFYFLSIFN
jgi:hypothetical protein